MQTDCVTYKENLSENGFAVIENVFSESEVNDMIAFIEKQSYSIAGYGNKDVFAIRKLFSAVPALKQKIFNDNIKCIVRQLFGTEYFITKGIYFDKPALSNWFVAYHQDISIAVSNKNNSPLYKGWTSKGNEFGVEPPLEILESIYTIRIHLDDCTSANGALHVIPGSHKNGIQKAKDVIKDKKNEVACEVAKGGVMLMRPLLMHSSHKNTVNKSRRVLHIEFSNASLPASIQWAEKEII